MGAIRWTGGALRLLSQPHLSVPADLTSSPTQKPKITTFAETLPSSAQIESSVDPIQETLDHFHKISQGIWCWTAPVVMRVRQLVEGIDAHHMIAVQSPVINPAPCQYFLCDTPASVQILSTVPTTDSQPETTKVGFFG